MKKILFFTIMTLSHIVYSQNQKWTGEKDFAPNLRFKNVTINNSNTRLLSISPTGKPEYIDKSFLLGGVVIPTLDQVLNAGNESPNQFTLSFGASRINYTGSSITMYNATDSFSLSNLGFTNSFGGKVVKLSANTGLELNTTGNSFANGIIKSSLLTAVRNYELPNNSGTLLTDAPSDNQSYVRNNNAWQVSSGGGSGTSSYKVYTVVLAQSSTNAPTANVSENTLIGSTITYSYIQAGVYSVTINFTQTIDTNKVAVLLNPYANTDFRIGYDSLGITSTQITFNLKSRFFNGTFSDDILANSVLEVRLYN